MLATENSKSDKRGLHSQCSERKQPQINSSLHCKEADKNKSYNTYSNESVKFPKYELKEFLSEVIKRKQGKSILCKDLSRTRGINADTEETQFIVLETTDFGSI